MTKLTALTQPIVSWRPHLLPPHHLSRGSHLASRSFLDILPSSCRLRFLSRSRLLEAGRTTTSPRLILPHLSPSLLPVVIYLAFFRPGISLFLSPSSTLPPLSPPPRPVDRRDLTNSAMRVSTRPVPKSPTLAPTSRS